MTRTRKSGLSQAVRGALEDETRSTPAAELALVYAARIDEAAHVRLPLDKALRTLRNVCGSEEDFAALDKVTAALSAVTVAGDLGPKLLATLDALLLTPKAGAALERKLPTTDGKPANPLHGLRDELQERRDRRTAG